jgi:DNA polymerase (family 10)
MENITIARLLDETASLLEIDASDPFRIRSYRRAAEAVEQQTTQLASLVAEPKQLLAIAGIGKGMAANIVDLVNTGTMPLRDELLKKYRPTMLELLRLPGMGPKTVALVWSALNVCDIDALDAAAKAGQLNTLPRMGEKFVAKLIKGIEDHRKNSSRFRVDQAKEYADRIAALILAFPGIDQVTPAGSLRRGRETVGDLDLLATGPACEPDVVAAAVEYVATLPLIDKLMARGQNKVTFTLRNNLQVDVRLLPRASYGAALQYFTGSKHHNVALRQRAIKRGLTLSEYALLRLEDNVIVAAATEEEIYRALDLDWIPPELRENCGELDAAAAHTLPTLITRADIRGDLHMHTEATDGRDTIRQMAEAALERGLSYIAITDHSKNLAMTNGLDDARALAHVKRIREVNQEMEGRIRVLPGIEVDILADGSLDLDDSTLAQMDIVVASVHSHFAQPIEEMTARVLRALENPHLRILGHPTGRKLLRREPYAINIDAVLRQAAALGVAVEHNASPARADLNDLHLRLAKELGCKIVVDTDAHATEELDQMAYGITQLRRAWLTPADVLNTLPVDAFLAALRAKP